MEGYYYDKIALDYDLKRRKPWKSLQNFVAYLKEKGYSFNGINVDLGCANGRNFNIFKNSQNKIVGIDNSIDLLQIAQTNLRDPTQYDKRDSNNIQIILADIRNLPIRPNIIHNMFSIATIHHVKSKNARDNVLKQIHHSIKENGLILLTVWRKWQKKYKKQFILNKIKRVFNPTYKKKQKKLGLGEFGDKIIPWTVSSTKVTCERFYHFFSKKELKKLVKDFQIKELKISGGSTDKDNFFLLAQQFNL